MFLHFQLRPVYVINAGSFMCIEVGRCLQWRCRRLLKSPFASQSLVPMPSMHTTGCQRPRRAESFSARGVSDRRTLVPHPKATAVAATTDAIRAFLVLKSAMTADNFYDLSAGTCYAEKVVN